MCVCVAYVCVYMLSCVCGVLRECVCVHFVLKLFHSVLRMCVHVRVSVHISVCLSVCVLDV